MAKKTKAAKKKTSKKPKSSGGKGGSKPKGNGGGKKSIKKSKKHADGMQTVGEYAFPTKSRCPSCKGTKTKAMSTQKQWQYRKCLNPVCRHRYTVHGEKI